jgi:hypothetical protein
VPGERNEDVTDLETGSGDGLLRMDERRKLSRVGRHLID